MGRFCLLVELHLEGSAPAASAAGLFCQVFPSMGKHSVGERGNHRGFNTATQRVSVSSRQATEIQAETNNKRTV